METTTPKRPTNRFTDSYEGIAQHAATREEAMKRISEMAQGMTMDYMSEYSQESAAIRWAQHLVDERWPVA